MVISKSHLSFKHKQKARLNETERKDMIKQLKKEIFNLA